MPIGKPPSEHAEAVALARWLTYRGICFAHAPNEGKRSPAVAARLKAEGMSPGVPDYLIFSPVPDRPEIRGVAVELKRQPPSYRGPTVTQRRWLTALTEHGWACHVARGAEDAIEWLQRLGL